MRRACAAAISGFTNRGAWFQAACFLRRQQSPQLAQQLSALAVLLALLLVGPPTADTRAAEIDAEQIEAFIAKQEAAAKKAHTRLLKAIDSQVKLIRKSSADPDLRIQALEQIERDRDQFDTTGKLPSCDDLLPIVLDNLDAIQSVYNQIDTFRARVLDAILRKGLEKTKATDLDELESSVAKFIGGRNRLSSGTKWSGSRQWEGGAMEITLEIDKLEGTQFSGTMIQTVPGARSKMEVIGELRGNHISFQKLKMVRGPDREFAAAGYLLSDRIVAEVAGNAPRKQKNRDRSGWVSLWLK